MITRIKIHGFKSFQNFEMVFTPLTVIAGSNASGKSNLFDAIRLLSKLAETDLRSAFVDQRGNPEELFTQYDEDSYAEEMCFEVDLLVNKTVKDNWGGTKELKYTRLRYELEIKRTENQHGFEDLVVKKERLVNLKHSEDEWIKMQVDKANLDFWRPKVDVGKRGTPYIETEYEGGVPRIMVPQDGSSGGNKKTFPVAFSKQTVLSSITTVEFPHVFAAREELRSWRFLQLNPEDLSKPTLQQPGMQDMISPSGKNMAAALHRLKQEDSYSIRAISRKINEFVPNFTEVLVDDDRSNRQFVIKLKSVDGKEFTSRVLSEGTLRLLALCILEQDEKHSGLLCFEEPENGIHPYRIKSVISLLKNLSTDFGQHEAKLRQVIVNTHSPVLVGELNRFQSDKTVSIWFSRMTTLHQDIGQKRVRTSVSKITPVKKINAQQLSLPYSESELKLSLATVKEYLHSADFNFEH